MHFGLGNSQEDFMIVSYLVEYRVKGQKTYESGCDIKIRKNVRITLSRLVLGFIL